MQHNPAHLAKRPPRLKEIFEKYRFPIYFVTFGTRDRKPILANKQIYEAFKTFAEKRQLQRTTIGRFVIMPDHIHLFIRLSEEQKLGATIGYLKKALSAELSKQGHPSPHWQPGFFDRLMRSANDYSFKWDYVKDNPVRAGLVNEPRDWKFAGELFRLEY